MKKNNRSKPNKQSPDKKADGADKSQTATPDIKSPNSDASGANPSNTTPPNSATLNKMDRSRHSKPAKPAVTLDLKASSSTSNNPKSEDSKLGDEKDVKPTPVKAEEAKKPYSSGTKSTPAATSEPKIDKSSSSTAKSDADKKPAQSNANKANANKAKTNAANANTAKTDSTKKPEPAKQDSGFNGKLIAGLCGGIIAIGGWTALQQSGILPAPAQQSATATTAPNNNSTKEIDALKQQINEQISSFTSKITGLEQKIAKTSTAKTTSAISPKISEKLKALSTEVAQLSKRKAVDIAPLSSQMKELQTQLATSQSNLQAIKTQFEASIHENKALTARLEDLEKALKDEGPEQKAAKVLAATALQNQVARGENFAAALESYQEITGDDKSFASLAPFAESGVPTLATLQQQFDGLSDTVLSALEPKPKEGDIFAQLLSSAKSLVKVKPVEGQTGDAPTAVLGRIKTALNNGNIDLVIKEWQRLPDAGQKAGAKWIKAIETRQDANGILDKTLHNMMTN